MTALTRSAFCRLQVVAIAQVMFLATLAWCAPRDEKQAPTAPPDDKSGAHVTVRTPDIHAVPLQVDVNMVVVNVTVTDPYDRIVTGLDQENFAVYDEKVEQQILAFSTEDAPIDRQSVV